MPRSCQSTAVADLRFMQAGPDDPLAQPLLSELAAEYSRQPQAEALYEAAGYTRRGEPLPSWGPFEPIAFAKGLP